VSDVQDSTRVFGTSHVLLQSVHTGKLTFTQYVLNTDFGHGYFAM